MNEGVMVDKSKEVLTVEFVRAQVQFGQNVPEEIILQVSKNIIEFASAFS